MSGSAICSRSIDETLAIFQKRLKIETAYKPLGLQAIIQGTKFGFAIDSLCLQLMSSVPLNRTSATPVTTAARPVAVVDIGATSVRMAIAEIDPRGSVRILEEVSQAVSLGKDTFTTQQDPE